MNEKEFREILRKLKISPNLSDPEIAELLDSKLNEYLERLDDNEEIKSDIYDAQEYVEKKIKEYGGGIGLPSKKTLKEEKFDKEKLKNFSNSKSGSKAFNTETGDDKSSDVNQSKRSKVNTNSKAWFYSVKGDSNIDDMFELAEKDLQNGDFSHAEVIFDTILQVEVTNAGAYMGKALAKYQLSEPNKLGICSDKNVEHDADLRRASDCGNEKQKKFINDILEYRKNSELFLEAERILKNAKNMAEFQNAESKFDVLGSFQEADKKAEFCRDEIRKIQKAEAVKKKRQKMISALVILGLIISGAIFCIRYMTPTYYGTSFYLGSNFNYKEYSIAKSAKRIASGIFKGTGITSIVIPESVERIEESAFADCKSLETIVLSEGLKSIGKKAFYGCTSLNELNLPSGVEIIEEQAFENCYELSEVVWNEQLQNVGSCAFASTKLSSLSGIPINIISEDTFYNCRNLKLTEVEAEKLSTSQLYKKSIPDTVLLENEQQLCNAVQGEYLIGNVMIEYGQGEFRNIQFEENQMEKTAISFDYLLNGCLYSVEGEIRRDTSEGDDSDINCDLNLVEAIFEKEFLLEKDEKGDYSNLSPIMKNQMLSYKGSEITLGNKEINNFNVIDVKENKNGGQSSVDITLTGDVETMFTTLSFEGTLKISVGENGANSEFIQTSMSDSGMNLFGVYKDGDSNVIIEQKLENYYYLGNDQLIDVSPKYAGSMVYIEYDEYTANEKEVVLDYETGEIHIGENRVLTKVENKEVRTENLSVLSGIWKGNMYMKVGLSGEICEIPYTAYSFDRGDGSATAVMDWSYTTQKGSHRAGIYISQWAYDTDSRGINMNHGGFYHVEDGYHERWFHGNVSEDGNTINTDLIKFVRQ